jgi:hypothetical protein
VFRANVTIININYSHVQLTDVKTAGEQHSVIESRERELKKQVA